MMRIDLISAVPEMAKSPLQESIIRNASDKGLVNIYLHDLHDYSADKHNKVDDTPYGGGAGMVLTPQPAFSCIESLKAERDYDEIIFPTPDSPRFEQQQANELSLKENIIFLCGHYKGIDQRIRDQLVTCEYSIGDVVLSGGELPALAMIDAIVRLLPGVLGNAESALTDSFQNESELVEGPVFTRPAEYQQMAVPDVLRSGNHQKIEQWRREQSLKRTRQVRPDLYRKFQSEE
jgi:tRNA (guanine37-N1)-methyltransferase